MKKDITKIIRFIIFIIEMLAVTICFCFFISTEEMKWLALMNLCGIWAIVDYIDLKEKK